MGTEDAKAMKFLGTKADELMLDEEDVLADTLAMQDEFVLCVNNPRRGNMLTFSFDMAWSSY
jgi:hypothetical protein